MNTYEFDIILTLEGTDRDDAEDTLRDYLESESAFIDYIVHPHIGEAVV